VPQGERGDVSNIHGAEWAPFSVKCDIPVGQNAVNVGYKKPNGAQTLIQCSHVANLL
jgi:hypothetical protein